VGNHVVVVNRDAEMHVGSAGEEMHVLVMRAAIYVLWSKLSIAFSCTMYAMLLCYAVVK
jgi:hypothetical protein